MNYTTIDTISNTLESFDFNFCSVTIYKIMHPNKVLYLRIIHLTMHLAESIGKVKTDNVEL